MRYTLPLVEKNSTKSCVDEMKRFSTKSFSLRFTPAMPLPPRFCWR